MNTAPRVICLAGPTGSGKTAAALALARALDGEVINADSRQTYARFPVITAQPSPEEAAVCPHHLYGFLDTRHKLSAGRWADMAADTVGHVAARGKTPILVGGTGLYFRALLEGIAAIPALDPDIATRWLTRMEDEGLDALYAHLLGVDPAYAERIHPHDKQRIVRALEVFEGTGKPFSWWHANAMPEPLCHGLYMGLETSLAALEPRLAQRIEAMLAAGALDEARQARQDCDDKNAPGWTGIGCAEILHHLRGERDLAQTKDLWLRNTRAYAKRQLTWFRAVPGLLWFTPEDTDGLCAAAREFMETGAAC